MTKSDLIKRISLLYPNMMLKDIRLIVDTIFNEIKSALEDHKRVEIRDFGAFSLRERRGRQARNPKTNEPVVLQDRVVPYFRAGKGLRNRLNEKEGI